MRVYEHMIWGIDNQFRVVKPHTPFSIIACHTAFPSSIISCCIDSSVDTKQQGERGEEEEDREESSSGCCHRDRELCVRERKSETKDQQKTLPHLVVFSLVIFCRLFFWNFLRKHLETQRENEMKKKNQEEKYHRHINSH